MANLLNNNRVRMLLGGMATMALVLLHHNLNAQVDYLRPIGGSEVELLWQLDASPESGNMLRDGQNLRLRLDGIDATYTLSRGRVTRVVYHERFASMADAEAAAAKIRKFMMDKGMAVRELHQGASHRVLNAAGGGMNGTMITRVMDGGGFQVNADISAMH